MLLGTKQFYNNQSIIFLLTKWLILYKEIPEPRDTYQKKEFINKHLFRGTLKVKDKSCVYLKSTKCHKM